MTTLNELGFNFKTTENSIKTVGTILIIILGIALTISEAFSSTSFIL